MTALSGLAPPLRSPSFLESDKRNRFRQNSKSQHSWLNPFVETRVFSLTKASRSVVVHVGRTTAHNRQSLETHNTFLASAHTLATGALKATRVPLPNATSAILFQGACLQGLAIGIRILIDEFQQAASFTNTMSMRASSLPKRLGRTNLRRIH